MNKIICVYKITSPSGRIYVGSTIDFKERIKHYRCLDCKAQVKLYNSFKKYGFKRHKIEIITTCTIDTMFQHERYYGDLYNVMSNHGLNLSLPGYGDTAASISQQTKDKMRASQTKEKNNFYGRRHTAESIAKMKAAQSNKSPETLQRMSDAQKGKIPSVEIREKMRQSQLGRKHSDQTKLKMRLSNQHLKLVLCLRTGIFYNGAKEAALTYGMNPRTLQNKLNGAKRNNTHLIFA